MTCQVHTPPTEWSQYGEILTCDGFPGLVYLMPGDTITPDSRYPDVIYTNNRHPPTIQEQVDQLRRDFEALKQKETK